MKRIPIIVKGVVLSAVFIAGPVAASEELTADEIKALFSNKTFDIHNVVKDKRLQAYDSADGKHIVYIPWKDKTSKRKWWQRNRSTPFYSFVLYIGIKYIQN